MNVLRRVLEVIHDARRARRGGDRRARRLAWRAAGEQALTRWARGARYAGSKDRAAVRDHVYDVLRRLRSARRWAAARTGGR
jgi:hypothetical protein